MTCRNFEDLDYREERAAAAAHVPHVRLHHGRHHSPQGRPYVHQEQRDTNKMRVKYRQKKEKN